MISHYLIDIIILLATAVIAVPFFQMIRFGAVPGFLISGIIVGPSGLGLISNIEQISKLAEIGVVLLLFVIGIELKPSRLWLMRRLVFGLGSMQVIFTGIALGFMFYYLFDMSLVAAILVGPALALSSTALVLQLLSEQKLLTSEYGRSSFSILLLQDIAVVPLLALVPLLATPEISMGTDVGLTLLKSLLILLLLILIGRYLLHPIVHRVALSGSAEVFTASAVLIVLGMAILTEYAGFSMAMGAFLAGLLISDSAYRHQITAEIHPFRGLLLGLFFMSMGMSVDLMQLFNNPLISIVALVLLILVKMVILLPLTYLFKIKKKARFSVMLVLAQSGEFALVLFSLAHQSQLLDTGLFQQLLLIVLLSMLTTPLLAHFAKNFCQTQRAKDTAQDENLEQAPIVIVGFGRVGHRIGEILSIAKTPYVALDYDAKVVEQERKNDHPIFYGDARKPKVLQAIGAGKTKIVLVTLGEPEIALQVVSSLRKSYPDLQIYARGHRLEQCQALQEVGASGAVSENIEASLELAQMALKKIQFNSKQRESIVENFRKDYHEQINLKGG